MKILRSIVFTCYLLLGSIFATWSQPIGIDILGGQEKIEFPFRLEQGFIIVNIKLSGILNFDFIFDTGAENIVLFEKIYADLLDIRSDKIIVLTGSDFVGNLKAHIARNVLLQLERGNEVRRDIIFLDQNLLNLEQNLGIRIDGILGASSFKGLVVNINYKKKKITLSHPEKFTPPDSDKWHSFDLEIIQNKPYVRAELTLNGVHHPSQKFLIDSGAAIPLIVHTNTDTTLVLPQFVVQGTLGHGLSGPLKGYHGLSDLFKLKSFEFPQIITAFQNIESVHLSNKNLYRNGVIGNKLLSRFEVIINYLDQKLYLKPIKKFNKEFAYDKSGINVIALANDKKEFYIKSIIPNSPAHQAGLRSGDIITKIGCWKSKWYTLEKLLNKLSDKAGKKIKLKVRRGSKKMKFEFKLRNLFMQTKKEM